MRLLFAGTPGVAVESLQALVDSSHEVCAVLTRPDSVAGRGRRSVRSSVAQRADSLGVPVLAPRSLREPDFLRALTELRPDCCPVVAFGALIPPEALSVPPHGWVNLHFSLLPRWRGAAPVQYAVRHGDAITGATTFRLDSGLDTGPVLGRIEEPIGPRDTSGDLLERLARRGAGLLASTMDGLARGDLVAVAQDAEGVTYAPKIEVDDARVLWSDSADAVDRLIRACTPAPGAWSTFRGERIKFAPVQPSEAVLPPGALAAGKNEVLVGTSTSAVALTEVRPEGRRPMPAADWARGVRPDHGEAFE